MAPPSNRSKMRKKPRNRSLNALAIASAQTSEPSTVPAHRFRKQSRGDEGDGGDGNGHGSNRGSDSEGNEWKVGQVDSEDDSDLDSDEAMGESDEERFADFAFRGSSSTGKSKRRGDSGRDLDEGEEDEGEGEDEDEDGEGYVDLSEMLDRAESSGDDEAPSKGRSRGGKKILPADLKEGDPSDSSVADESGSDDEDEDEDEAESLTDFSEEDDEVSEDPSKLAALQSLISSLPSTSHSASKKIRLNDSNEGKTPNEYNLELSSSRKLTIEDLLPSITDPKISKSLKLIANDAPAKAGKSGVQGKLSAPLAKRQQDRLDRAAAYEESKKTLGRWVDTVKHGREADHLHFPLANAPNAPVPEPKKLAVVTPNSTPLTELEATISGILKDSNLASDKSIMEFEELQTNKLSLEEVKKRTAELRLARELLYREEIKAKRIKKIKSKSYHRIHKKERLKQQHAIEEALALERGGMPDEEEAMERERKRAVERMTLRHKQSKWAKGMKESGRTLWDEEAQDGAIEMAKRSEELRMRMEGKGIREDGGESGSSSEEEEEEGDLFNENQEQAKKRLLQELEKLEAESDISGGKPQSKLMALKFMQNAEAAQKKENKAQLESLRRALEDDGKLDRSNGSEDDDDDGAQRPGGRMTFTAGKKQEKPDVEKKNSTAKLEFEEAQNTSGEDDDTLDQPKITFTNKASLNISRNPFSQPGAPRPQLSNPKAKSDKTSTAHPPPKAQQGKESNPWLIRSSDAAPAKPKAQVLVSGKQESKSAKTNLKLSKSRKRALKSSNGPEPDVEIDTSASLKLAARANHEGEGDDKEINLIPAHGKKGSRPYQRELVKRAFAGDNVVEEFTAEKKRRVEDEGDKTVDTRLPGWGSWTGSGAPKYPRERGKKYLETIKGIDKDKRKDRKLERVIINEKRVKKNVKYKASALPFPFESKQQYERSLRTPIGPEWTTKESFQSSTMPRVIVKRGTVVEPISAPFK